MATPSKAAVRKNATLSTWPASARPLSYGREQFRFRISRTERQLPGLDIDAWVETADWQRQNGQRMGDLNFRRPLGSHAASMIANGDHVICEWAEWGPPGPWRRLWEMKIATPAHEVQPGIVSLALASSLSSSASSKVAWKFRVDPAHPHGWTADQITLSVCRRFGIPLTSMPKGTYRITSYVPKSASPNDVIVWAWTQERTHTGRRFNVDLSTGAVQVSELTEPRYLLVLGASMMDATVSQTLDVASAVVATATKKKRGKKPASKLRAKVVDPGRLKRYGYVVRTLTAPAGISSVAELRAWARKQLAALFASRKQITFLHPGLPLVDVGTPLRIYLPEADLDQLMWVLNASHSLAAGSYQMQVTVGFDDPVGTTTATHKTRVAAKKMSAARSRGRVSHARAASAPTPKKAKVRARR